MIKAVFLGLKSIHDGELNEEQPYDIGTTIFVEASGVVQNNVFPWKVVKCDKYPQLVGDVLTSFEVSFFSEEINMEDWL